MVFGGAQDLNHTRQNAGGIPTMSMSCGKMTRSLWMRATLVALALTLALVACGDGLLSVAAKKSKNKVVSGAEKLAVLHEVAGATGVVEVNSDMYDKLVLRPDRPYHVIALFTAIGEKFSCAVCQQVHPEFQTLAASYMTAKQVKLDTRDGLDVVFVIVDFELNQQIFGVYGFTSAPHIAYFAPDRTTDLGKESMRKTKIPEDDMYNVYQSGKTAEGIVQFVRQKTGFEFEIQRSKMMLYAAGATTLVSLAIAAVVVVTHFEKVIHKLRRKSLWMTVSLLFYGLSVSGMVYCIIREPAAYAKQRNGEIKYFHPAGRSQYVVEGLIVGSYDILAAGFVILLSQWAIYIHRPQLRMVLMVGCITGFVFMYRQMIGAYKMKNRWYTGWMGF